MPADPALEWWRILRQARERLPAGIAATDDDHDAYFALCCAAHHGTVGTYTPTDVDAKIRGHLWRDCPASHLPQRWATVEAWCGWDERLVSVRGEDCGEQFWSNHWWPMARSAARVIRAGDAAGRRFARARR